MDLSNSSSRIRANSAGQNQPKAQSHTVGRLSSYAQNQPLTQIREGQVLRGEVTDLRNREITLTLEDNTTVNARLTNATSLSIGDTASFLVNQIIPGKITLEIIPQSQLASENNIIRKVLEESMLPKNEQNQNIVRELIHNQLPINKQAIQDMLRLSVTNPDIGVQSLALMKKYNMPLTRETMVSFESYRNGSHALSEQLTALSDQIGKLLSDSSSLYGTETAARFASKVISTLLSSSQPAFSANPEDLSYLSKFALEPSAADEGNPLGTEQENAPGGAGETLSRLLSGLGIPESTMENIQNEQISLPALSKAIFAAMEHANELDTDQKMLALEQMGAKADTMSAEELAETLSQMPSAKDVFQDPLIQTILDDYQAYQSEHAFIGGIFSREERTELLNALENFPLGSAMKQKIIDGTATQQETLNIIKNLLSFSKSEDTEKLLSNPQLQTLVKHRFNENFLLTPQQLLNGAQKSQNVISDFYQKMANQLKGLSTLADSLPASGAAAALSETIQNTASNLSFLNTLNQFYPYVQLPMELTSQITNGDLYVFAKKKTSLSDGKPISVLLRLNLEHLGSLDVHLTAEQNKITSRFYLDNDEGRRLLKTNISLLREPLNDQGYTLTSEFLKKEQDFDIVKDLIARDAPPAGNIRYNFDIRA